MSDRRSRRLTTGSSRELISLSNPLHYPCSSLRSRLLSINDFAHFFQQISASDAPVNPVTQLQDVFSLGIPLCYLYNLLPPSYPRISVECDPLKFDPNDLDEHAAKFAISLFAMHIKHTFPDCEPFTFAELLNRNSTEGLVRVSLL